MKILYLPLKAKWYNMIDSGVKPEDYRDIKPYWQKRLNKDYTHVMFSYGYTKRKMIFRINRIITGYGITEWGAPSDKKVFIIKLGLRELKIGEIFEYERTTFEVFKSDSCIDCYFNDLDICTIKFQLGLCSSDFRIDKTSVSFKEVLK